MAAHHPESGMEVEGCSVLSCAALNLLESWQTKALSTSVAKYWGLHSFCRTSNKQSTGGCTGVIVSLNQYIYSHIHNMYVWYGMVWYGMVWYGKVWYGMERYGKVR